MDFHHEKLQPNLILPVIRQSTARTVFTNPTTAKISQTKTPEASLKTAPCPKPSQNRAKRRYRPLPISLGKPLLPLLPPAPPLCLQIMHPRKKRRPAVFW